METQKPYNSCVWPHMLLQAKRNLAGCLGIVITECIKKKKKATEKLKNTNSLEKVDQVYFLKKLKGLWFSFIFHLLCLRQQ